VTLPGAALQSSVTLPATVAPPITAFGVKVAGHSDGTGKVLADCLPA
jgi:hypothetical protein